MRFAEVVNSFVGKGDIVWVQVSQSTPPSSLKHASLLRCGAETDSRVFFFAVVILNRITIVSRFLASLWLCFVGMCPLLRLTHIFLTRTVMLLPMILRSLISGASAQGENTRKELARVSIGVPSEITTAVGLNKAAIGSSPVSTPIDEGVADVNDGAIEEDEDTEFADALQKAESAAEKNGKGGVKIGFFLHTPFPSSEIYR